MDSIPYCGVPPAPGSVAWNLDPSLIALLLAVGFFYEVGRGRRAAHGPKSLQRNAFFLGWLIIVAVLVSPLCNLSVALFSARVTQHMIIVLMAAPLLAWGAAGHTIAAALAPRIGAPAQPNCSELVATTAIFAAVIWIWHSPKPYEAALASSTLYWVMQITIIISSVRLWRLLLQGGLGYGLIASFITGLQMSLLGFLLTFSPKPLFTFHIATSPAWGLTALSDQQIGGLIMWIIGGAILTSYSLLLFAMGLKRLAIDQPSLPSRPFEPLRRAYAR